MIRDVPAVRPGDTIRASWANGVRRGLQDLTRRLATLEGQFQSLDSNSGHNLQSAGGTVSLPTSISYSESSRSATSRTITDSGTDTHTVSIATQIVLAATGATGGMPSSITLIFDAPT